MENHCRRPPGARESIDQFKNRKEGLAKRNLEPAIELSRRSGWDERTVQISVWLTQLRSTTDQSWNSFAVYLNGLDLDTDEPDLTREMMSSNYCS